LSPLGKQIRGTRLALVAFSNMTSHPSEVRVAYQGSRPGRVPTLLRRLADKIESFGDVEVERMDLRSEQDHGDGTVSITVYVTDYPL
jgi:hypothetical protein